MQTHDGFRVQTHDGFREPEQMQRSPYGDKKSDDSHVVCMVKWLSLLMHIAKGVVIRIRVDTFDCARFLNRTRNKDDYTGAR